MIALIVRFDIRDEESARLFDALTAEVVEAISAKEPGTLVYATHSLVGDPLVRVFYEIYADDDAFQAHERAAHVSDFHARKEPLLAGKPGVQFVTPAFVTGLPTSGPR